MLRLIRKIFFWFLVIFIGSSVLAVVAYRFIPVYITPLMIIRALHTVGNDVQKARERHWKHHWVAYDEISEWMPKAVVASEDGHFYEHHGFDFQQIKQAVEENKRGKRKRGASTISQQTAKNVFLWQGRSWIRKGLEAYFTVLIEFFWSKDRIIEVYLNSIEMGAGIYGVDAAAEFYFNKQAINLNKRECALIAVSLPSPLKRDPANPSSYLKKRANQIMRYM